MTQETNGDVDDVDDELDDEEEGNGDDDDAVDGLVDDYRDSGEGEASRSEENGSRKQRDFFSMADMEKFVRDAEARAAAEVRETEIRERLRCVVV